ncbi:hypothetical protein BpHYR1_026344 [Brachionus plicatilis]|uniref:Uncharacterized protein n=1 Tax=Brachionus plicatilis TaxID=10195 RepID=A0A3M7PRN9_BRAPC|nr:hypothetical protein BpHYR1_026344 [Brachionus plicatilis]
MSSVLIFVFSGWVLANVWNNMVGDSEREHTVLDFGEDECFVYGNEVFGVDIFVLFALIFMPHLFAKSCIILVAFCNLRSIVLRFLLAHHTVM